MRRSDITEEMRDQEPFRWCVYCDADCHQDDPDHAEDCPSNTGIYPVRPSDLGEPCVHCGERTPGLRCCRCGTNLAEGDSYMHIQAGWAELIPGIPAPVREIVCVGCKARAELDDAA